MFLLNLAKIGVFGVFVGFSCGLKAGYIKYIQNTGGLGLKSILF